MKRVDYTEYDDKLLNLIAGGCNTFGSLVQRMDAYNKNIDPSADRFRITDRRLQALRRKGMVEYYHKQWCVMPD